MDLDQPTKNFPLLWKVYDHIVAHPDEWRQQNWAMREIDSLYGTAFCCAGHAVIFAHPDAEMVWNNSNFASTVRVGGIECYIDDVAQEDLGLTAAEANALFEANNNLEQIHSLILNWEHQDQQAWLAAHTA